MQTDFHVLPNNVQLKGEKNQFLLKSRLPNHCQNHSLLRHLYICHYLLISENICTNIPIII